MLVYFWGAYICFVIFFYLFFYVNDNWRSETEKRSETMFIAHNIELGQSFFCLGGRS